VALDLYWIPLGAGAYVVRASGRTYECFFAFVQHGSPRDLYHSALVAAVDGASVVIEMTLYPTLGSGWSEESLLRALLGRRHAGRLRLFRYEIRRWQLGGCPTTA
jgi:hypothetical protein